MGGEHILWAGIYTEYIVGWGNILWAGIYTEYIVGWEHTWTRRMPTEFSVTVTIDISQRGYALGGPDKSTAVRTHGAPTKKKI